MQTSALLSVLAFLLLGACSGEAEQDADPSGEQQDDDDDSDADDDAPSTSRDAGVDARVSDARVATDARTTSPDAVGSMSADAQTSARDAAADARAREAGAVDASLPASDAGLARFSFFVTSLKAMRELANDQNGFGGDLRFGETGEGAGLRGADKICTTIAEKSMPGSGAKQWRAFLSATKGGASGGAVHAIERVGSGPWYDRLGRVVAMSKADLAQTRPANAHAAIVNDLPNEDGVPNHNPDGTGEVDNHHILTGSNDRGQLYANTAAATCNDWTKSTPDQADAPRVGLSWPRGGRGGGGGGGAGAQHWISAMDESGCGKGVSLVEMGGPVPGNPTVGSGGGYGAIYCFALSP